MPDDDIPISGSKRVQRRLKMGRELRSRLKAEGRHIDAQTVQDLCLSLGTSVGLNAQLTREAMLLRKVQND